MKYIGKQVESGYEITHVKEMEDVNGSKVEVVYGKNIIEKEKLEKSIEDLKVEKEEKMIQMDNDIAELEAILKSVNDIK
jgi:hypothetical protein